MAKRCGECHCRGTVSCLLGAPVKTIVSTQLTHGWPVQAGAAGRVQLQRGTAPGTPRNAPCEEAGWLTVNPWHRRTRPRPWIRRYAWYFHENSLIQQRQKCPYRARPSAGFAVTGSFCVDDVNVARILSFSSPRSFNISTLALIARRTVYRDVERPAIEQQRSCRL